jgi:hypothetical protein
MLTTKGTPRDRTCSSRVIRRRKWLLGVSALNLQLAWMRKDVCWRSTVWDRGKNRVKPAIASEGILAPKNLLNQISWQSLPKIREKLLGPLGAEPCTTRVARRKRNRSCGLLSLARDIAGTEALETTVASIA